MKVLDKIWQRFYVAHVDDERELGNGVIITLQDNYFFRADPGCGVRGFDSLSEALKETSSKHVYVGVQP